MPSLKYLLQKPITQILAFILIISSWWNYTSVASSDFSGVQVLVICSYVTTVVCVQILLIGCLYFALRRRTYRLWIAAIISGVVLAVNLLVLLLIHFDEFAGLEFMYKSIWFAASCFAFYALVDVMSGSLWMRRTALFGAILLLAYSIIASALDISTDSAGVESKPTIVKLNKTPNIYFMGLDALSPESVAKRHLEVEVVTYAEALRENDFRTFENAFGDRAGTKNFFNSLIALDVDIFDKLPSDVERYQFFNGIRSGILFETFRANGYFVQTMYMNPMFGTEQGSFVDFYGISNRRDICTHIALFSNELAFMGLCHEFTRPLFAELVTSGLKRLGWDPMWDDFLSARMLLAAKAQRPWFTMAHTLAPAHVHGGYRHENEKDRIVYRETFIKREKIAADLIAKWVEFIKREDPNAILVISGDHGFWLTEGQYNHEMDTDEKRRFFVIDRHAISLSIWPKDTCQGEFDREVAKGHITVTQMVRALIRCLAGGTDPLPENVQSRLQYGWEGIGEEEYGTYTYE